MTTNNTVGSDEARWLITRAVIDEYKAAVARGENPEFIPVQTADGGYSLSKPDYHLWTRAEPSELDHQKAFKEACERYEKEQSEP